MARLALRYSAFVVCLLAVQAGPASPEPWRRRAQVAVPAPPAEEPRPEFSEFLSTIKEQAVAAGVSTATVDAALTNLEPLEVVVERDRTQAEVVLTIDQYLSRRLTRSFIRAAGDRAREHREALSEIAKKYGVASRVLVAVWGMESNFGRFTGTRPTVQALATLAWEGRRRAFFTTELINALQILDKGYIELGQMKGSWAAPWGKRSSCPPAIWRTRRITTATAAATSGRRCPMCLRRLRAT
jgi:membrane-bound lytic murein transglycosylase B